MKNISNSRITLLCSLLMLAGCSKEAEQVKPQSVKNQQNGIYDNTGGATQNGNGAYTQKYDRSVCMIHSLTGLNAGIGCTEMTQTKWMITPKGVGTSVWEGTLPTDAILPSTRPYIVPYTESETGVQYNCTTTFDVSTNTFKMTITNK
ncbi:hypothetical protein [Hymenobacter gelipurpurascens]|uniref:hypothetical protein n=1 Tax=Hymenobacter gelipurpurascens TaxID=89968 RepID=UPI0011313582|nr:hypothetical protein [Hymenobacter gelipurpurascens]